jgi:hypothetical protein
LSLQTLHSTPPNPFNHRSKEWWSKEFDLKGMICHAPPKTVHAISYPFGTLVRHWIFFSRNTKRDRLGRSRYISRGFQSNPSFSLHI